MRTLLPEKMNKQCIFLTVWLSEFLPQENIALSYFTDNTLTFHLYNHVSRIPVYLIRSSQTIGTNILIRFSGLFALTF